MAWTDWRTFSATNLDVYLHRFLAGGTPDPAWPVNGLSICNLAGTQNRSMLVSDDDGGVIVVGGTSEWTPPAALASTPSASPPRLDRGRLAGEWNLGVRVPGGQPRLPASIAGQDRRVLRCLVGWPQWG